MAWGKTVMILAMYYVLTIMFFIKTNTCFNKSVFSTDLYSCPRMYGHIIVKMPIIQWQRATYPSMPELLMTGDTNQLLRPQNAVGKKSLCQMG